MDIENTPALGGQRPAGPDDSEAYPERADIGHAHMRGLFRRRILEHKFSRDDSGRGWCAAGVGDCGRLSGYYLTSGFGQTKYSWANHHGNGTPAMAEADNGDCFSMKPATLGPGLVVFPIQRRELIPERCRDDVPVGAAMMINGLAARKILIRLFDSLPQRDLRTSSDFVTNRHPTACAARATRFGGIEHTPSPFPRILCSRHPRRLPLNKPSATRPLSIGKTHAPPCHPRREIRA